MWVVSTDVFLGVVGVVGDGGKGAVPAVAAH
jgi:hypothetical protein